MCIRDRYEYVPIATAIQCEAFICNGQMMPLLHLYGIFSLLLFFIIVLCSFRLLLFLWEINLKHSVGTSCSPGDLFFSLFVASSTSSSNDDSSTSLCVLPNELSVLSFLILNELVLWLLLPHWESGHNVHLFKILPFSLNWLCLLYTSRCV